MPTIADIEHEIENLFSVPPEELTPEQQDVWAEYCAELADQEAEKIDGFVRVIRASSARADHLKAEAKRLERSAATIERNIENLKRYYLTTMQTHGLEKVSGKVYSARIRKSSAVQVMNEAIIPDKFFRVKVERAIAKKEIAAAIKAGEAVPGAMLSPSYSLQTN